MVIVLPPIETPLSTVCMYIYIYIYTYIYLTPEKAYRSVRARGLGLQGFGVECLGLQKQVLWFRDFGAPG